MTIERGVVKTREELRKFGVTVGIAFAVLAGITIWRDHGTAATVLGSIAGVLLVGGIVAPAALRPVEKAWMGLAHVLSKVTTPIFLGIVYFVVLTPTGIVRRSVGRHPLRHAAKTDSYWYDRGDAPPSDLERQF
ncbi:MAG: SxtJ family membrane protein [Gemmatimonadota bacterium]|nr:SxtJ family membrane protein [Gemmatimonadota bacterium]